MVSGYARMTGALLTPGIIIAAQALSSFGDILLAFYWNATLIVAAPAIALTALGVVGVLGIAGGSILGPFLARIPNQAALLAGASIVRGLLVLVLALVVASGAAWALGFALLVQVIDGIVNALTAGSLTILLAETVGESRFTATMGRLRAAIQLGLLAGWVIAGAIVMLAGTAGLLLLDAATFVPISLVLVSWAVNSAPRTAREDEVGRPSLAPAIAAVAPFALAIVAASMVSRTGPVLWDAGTSSTTPDPESFGLIFAAFMLGFLAGSTIISIDRVAQWFASRARVILPLLAVLLGLAILALPLAAVFPVFLLVNGVTGLLAGLFTPTYFGLIRDRLHDASQRTAFYWLGTIGRYGEWVGSGAAGLVVSVSTIASVYLVSGILVALAALPIARLARR